METVKACYVSREMLSMPIEGNHIAARRLIAAAEGAGIEPYILTIETGKEHPSVPRNWEVIGSGTIPSSDLFGPRVILALNDLFKLVGLSIKAKSSDCQLVHVLNVSKEAYLLVHSLVRVKKPLLTHFFHSSYTLNDDIFMIRNLALRAGMYGRAANNHALTVNMSLHRFLVDELGARPENVHFAPCPIDTDTFRPLESKEDLRKKYGLPQDSLIIAYVGSLSPARGLFDIIRAFPDILSHVPEALLYVSYPKRAGEEDHEKHLYSLCGDLQQRGKIVLDGPSKSVQEIYSLVDVVALPFVRPYWVDPPLILLEAMSSGAVVVATPVGAMAEVLRDHDNAYVIKPGDPSALAETIVEVLEDPGAARRVALSARGTVVRDYSYDAVGKRLLTIYDSILN